MPDLLWFLLGADSAIGAQIIVLITIAIAQRRKQLKDLKGIWGKG